jgi:hypothetical protein
MTDGSISGRWDTKIILGTRIRSGARRIYRAVEKFVATGNGTPIRQTTWLYIFYGKDGVAQYVLPSINYTVEYCSELMLVVLSLISICFLKNDFSSSFILFVLSLLLCITLYIASYLRAGALTRSLILGTVNVDLKN